MLSEDTGTQGRRNAELELGYAWSQQDSASVFLFQPQLSYGTSPTFDLIIQPSWTYVDQMRCSKISCFLRPAGAPSNGYSKMAYCVSGHC